MKALEGLLAETGVVPPADFLLFYNASGPAVGRTHLEDVAEVFALRAEESIGNGVFGTRFEFFWEIISDGGGGSVAERSFWERLVDAVPSMFDLKADLARYVAERTAELLRGPDTDVDVENHRQRLLDVVNAGRRILIVAHSQGSLFANRAFDHVEANGGGTHVRAVHVAPATSFPSGEYKLADIDWVIAALDFLTGNMPPTNLDLQPSVQDWTGHKFMDTYLDRDRSGRSEVAGSIGAALRAVCSAD